MGRERDGCGCGGGHWGGSGVGDEGSVGVVYLRWLEKHGSRWCRLRGAGVVGVSVMCSYCIGVPTLVCWWGVGGHGGLMSVPCWALAAVVCVRVMASG